MTSNLREYSAMIWVKDSNQPERRVTVWASDLMEAKRLLDDEHGAENVFDLHNKEDAERPR